MEGRENNGKQLEIIEFNKRIRREATIVKIGGPKLTVVTAQKNLNDFTDLYKVNYLVGETFSNGMSQFSVIVNVHNFVLLSLMLH